MFFFFSSRRRHTRFDCDWSSDVCSSDLRRTTPTIRKCIVSICKVGSIGTSVPKVKLTKQWFTSNKPSRGMRSEEHTSELQSQSNLVCRLLLEKKNGAVRRPSWS